MKAGCEMSPWQNRAGCEDWPEFCQVPARGSLGKISARVQAALGASWNANLWPLLIYKPLQQDQLSLFHKRIGATLGDTIEVSVIVLR